LALIDEAKTALRVSTNDAGITAQIAQIIAEAQLDLCRTADISQRAVSAPDALIKGAIFCYARYVWAEDKDEKEQLKACYDDYKAKLSMSSAYGTYDGDPPPDSEPEPDPVPEPEAENDAEN